MQSAICARTTEFVIYQELRMIDKNPSSCLSSNCIMMCVITLEIGACTVPFWMMINISISVKTSSCCELLMHGISPIK